jgi:Fic family protein
VATRAPHREQIENLLKEYVTLSKGQSELLTKIAESEVAESIFNSNAIENSTLTLKETEQIIFDSYVGKGLELREVLEAKNLNQVYQLPNQLSEGSILKAHAALLSGINDSIAGRYRKKGESVRVGNHVAPPSEQVPSLIEDLLNRFESETQNYFVDKIARFHLEFELIHPFCDGNGRIGRVLVNWQLKAMKCPPIIIRNTEKKKYYSAFREFKILKKAAVFEKMILLALLESFHKRLAYLKKQKIITLAEWVRAHKASPAATYNAAKRQSIPAFRENEIWMIAK